MRVHGGWEKGTIAGGLAVVLCLAPLEAAAAPLETRGAGQPDVHIVLRSLLLSSSEHIDIAETEAVRREVSDSNSAAPTKAQAGDKVDQPGNPAGVPTEEQGETVQPVGTAVAPAHKTTGVAGTRPAGAVIAPAKQRRARSILIRVGVVVGAAAALGAVAAVSHASPSQPH